MASFLTTKVAIARDDECCEFRIIHQIKFQSRIQGHHVYKNVWSPYKGETLKVQPENSWLVMHQLNFQAYCINFIQQVLKIISTLK